MPSSIPSKRFSWFKRNFFPVYAQEYRKFLGLSLLMFCFTLVYGTVRACKDRYMLHWGGGKIIGDLKLVILVVSVFAISIYGQINQKTSSNGRFYWILGILMGFFTLFTIAKLGGFLEIPEVINGKKISKDMGLWTYISHGGIKAVVFVLFYTFAELWGIWGVSLLFWTCTNEICSVKQAKRCYTPLVSIAGLSTILSGVISIYFAESEKFLLGVILTFGYLLFVIYYFFSGAMGRNPEAYQIPKVAMKKVKKRLGLFSAVKKLVKSKDRHYLILITLMIFCYAFGVALYENVFKTVVKSHGIEKVRLKEFDTEQAYTSYVMGLQLVWIGILSLFISLGLGTHIRRKGWRFMALAAPVIVFLSVVLFFGFLIGEEWLMGYLNYTATGIRGIAMYLGLACVSLIKATKYACQDPAKEEAFVPLKKRPKEVGKAIADTIGSRFGKGFGSSVVGSGLGHYYGSILNVVPFVGLVMGSMMVVWVYVVFGLDKEHGAYTKEYHEQNQIQDSDGH